MSRYVIWMERNAGLGEGWLLKEGGWNLTVSDPVNATSFATREEARDARPGHSRDMGGSGFKGRVVPVSQARPIQSPH